MLFGFQGRQTNKQSWRGIGGRAVVEQVECTTLMRDGMRRQVVARPTVYARALEVWSGQDG